MATLTIDDELAEARAELGRVSSEIQAKGDAAALARAELDQLSRSEPDARSTRDTPAVTSWVRSYQAAQRRLELALSGVEDLDRRRREQERFVEQLEARRIPAIDDAIAEARRQLEAIPSAVSRAEVDLAAAEERQGRLEAAAALGDRLPAGEPAAAAAAIQDARSALEILATERSRLQRLVDALLERRTAQAADLAAAERDDVRQRWRPLADDAVKAAMRLQAIGLELDALDQEYSAAGVRNGERGMLVPTVGDLRFAPYELEQVLARARGLLLAPPKASS